MAQVAHTALYEQDFDGWLAAQLCLLKAGDVQALDVEHLDEEFFPRGWDGEECGMRKLEPVHG